MSDAAPRMLELINRERSQAGLPGLNLDREVDGIAVEWSGKMARAGRLSHNDDYLSEDSMERLNATTLGENVAVADSLENIHALLMDSPPHRANILNPDFRLVGLGAARLPTGELYLTEDFLTRREPPPAEAQPAPREHRAAPSRSARPAPRRRPATSTAPASPPAPHSPPPPPSAPTPAPVKPVEAAPPMDAVEPVDAVAPLEPRAPVESLAPIEPVASIEAPRSDQEDRTASSGTVGALVVGAFALVHLRRFGRQP